ncbi:MAG: peptidoglycan-binding protein, partial [Kiloniellales bacterium]
MAIDRRPQQEPSVFTARRPLPSGSWTLGRAARALAGLALAGLLAACGTLTERQATYSVHQRPTVPQQRVTPDSPPISTAQIARAQVLLTDLGYRPGPANGMVGPETEMAIRAFQEYEGLSVDGRMSAALMAQLEVADHSLRVRRAQ